jgi:hypothetical protein
MTKSNYVLARDIVQEPVTALLRTEGFTKKGRAYNRIAGNGLIHVVNFQMGQYTIGNYVIPGIRESYYGKFTVNLGVYLPCVSQLERGSVAKRIYQDYDCEIRKRLGTLAYEGQDVWWSLDNSARATGDLIVCLMREFGLPFLARYTDYMAVLAQYRMHGYLPFNNKSRSALVAAIICHHLGQPEQARALFDCAADRAVASRHTEFGTYVENIRKQCSL